MSIELQMFDGDSWLEPLLEEPLQTHKPDRKPEVFIVSKVKAWLPGTDKILAGLYLVFLVWQTAVLVPYTIHAVDCCFRSRQVSFQCEKSSIPHPLELELAMMISIVGHTVLVLWLLGKIPHFLGYKSIFEKLVRLPKFWSLVLFLVLGSVGLTIIHETSKNFFLLSALILSFGCYGVSAIALVGVLNYTQGEFIKQKYPFYKFVFFKLTLAVFLAENLSFALVGSLQLAAGVTGLNPEVSRHTLQQTSFETLRHFSCSVFYFILSDILWQKIFSDNRNVLHHHDYL